jgi:hypothetical protein
LREIDKNIEKKIASEKLNGPESVVPANGSSPERNDSQTLPDDPPSPRAQPFFTLRSQGQFQRDADRLAARSFESFEQIEK